MAGGGRFGRPRRQSRHLHGRLRRDRVPGFKPSRCAAGGLNLSKLQWRWWDSEHTATGTGEALLRKGYRAQAKLALSRPQQLHGEDGKMLRYFSRARLSVLYRSGNPLGERPGWRSYVVKVEASRGRCELSP